VNRIIKLPALAVLMLLLMGAAVACSDDSDDVSPEEAYCNSGESLQTSLESLLDLDVIAEGTNGVETAIENVQSNLSEFTDAAKDVTSDETQALEDAFGELESAFSALGDDGLSIENGSEVIDALTGLVVPAEAAFTTLTETC
jgi:hypothetical protein